MLGAAAGTAGDGGAEALTGLAGWVASVVESLGEPGVFLLTFGETVFPPIPSEVILPLAGFLSNGGDLDPWLVLLASTAGSVAGALVLYALAALLGERRAIALLAHMPLLDRDDADAADAWFHRHGRVAVFTGRLVPGVRSLISLPAGAARMPMAWFLGLTTAGSLLWNSLLVGAGYALGTQYQLVAKYAEWLDYALYAAIAGVLVWLVRRRLRKRSAARRATAPR